MKRRAMSAELRAYLECILWSETDESTPSGGQPLDRNFSVEDFAPESVALAEKDLNEFLDQVDKAVAVYDDTLEEEGALEEGAEGPDYEFSAGDVAHDFWLSRVGHGTGFWDHEERYGVRLAALFTKYAKEAGERYVTVGDNGKIYVE